MSHLCPLSSTMSHLCPLSSKYRICVLLVFPDHHLCPFTSMQTWHVRATNSLTFDDLCPQESESRKGVEESKTDRRLPTTPLPHKTDTWPARSHDLAITQTLLQNVKDISPYISVPQGPPEHHVAPPRPHLKLPSWHFI
jgi:hypothetical protein